MVDFLSAIHDGVRKSAEAKKAKDEINNTLREIANAINKFTKGELTLNKVVYNEKLDRYGFGMKHKTLSDLADQLGITASAHSFGITQKNALNTNNKLKTEKLPEKIEQPNALVLVHPTQRNGHQKVLAKWSQDPVGYPCIITAYYGYEYICSNKEELNSAFLAILRHPGFNDLVKSALNQSLIQNSPRIEF